MNHKSNTTIDGYFDDLCKLYRKLGEFQENVYFQRMLIYYYAMKKFNIDVYAERKALCQKHSPNVYLDFQTKQLGHCAMNVRMSNKVDFTGRNLKKMMKGDFSENSYCEKCYSFDNGHNRNMWVNRSYRQ